MSWNMELMAQTDRGVIRSHNEDAVLARGENKGRFVGVMVVSDGMGGHQAGEVASWLIVDKLWSLFGWYVQRDPERATAVLGERNGQLENRMKWGIGEANRAIKKHQEQNGFEEGRMGATVTAAFIVDSLAVIGSVGDSRAYLWRRGRLSQISQDHSYVGELVRSGHLRSNEVYDHPRRNVILRALNGAPVEADTFIVSLEDGDLLLLCSDGLWEMIRNLEEVVGQIASWDVTRIGAELIRLANQNGGEDNISVVIGRVRN